jgi:hypothetical protein
MFMSPMQVVGYLPESLGCFFILLAALRLWKRRAEKSLSALMNSVKNQRIRLLLNSLPWPLQNLFLWSEEKEKEVIVEQERRERERRRGLRGFAAWWPMWFALLAAFILAYAATLITDYPVYEYHNVKVLNQLGPNDWWIEREDGQTLWNGCPDFPNSKVIWAGYVMDKFRYQDFGKCKSILRSDLGVWWKRDPVTKDVVTIAEH